MNTMKAACVREFTQAPHDIVIQDLAVPEPGPGQVRVRMLVSPVNPSDLNFLRGTYYAALERVIWNQPRERRVPALSFDPAGSNPCPRPPYVLGGEGVGVVDACGPGLLARRLRGRRVAIAGGPPNGAWQQFTVVAAKRAVPVPEAVGDEQAAMYLLNPLTAYAMVRSVLRVPRGGWVLVTAAGSALGKSVVRMGRRDGFHTICVVRESANTAELSALGADAVIETNRQDLVREVAEITGGRGVGHALDCVGGELSAQVVRCLGPDGHLLLYGTLANAPVALEVRDLMMPGAKVSGFYLGHWMSQQSPFGLLQALGRVKRMTLEGVFHADVSEVHDLEHAAAAVEASLQPGRTGKVLLRIGQR